jgi:tetratricopeptide (TPR) repeat protein
MLWINLGAAYLDRPPHTTPAGEEQAIRAFERALELDPVAPSVSYNLGLIYSERGDLAQALAHFRAAICANPHDRDAIRWREAIQAELQRREQEESPRP